MANLIGWRSVIMVSVAVVISVPVKAASVEGVGTSLCSSFKSSNFTRQHVVGQWLLGHFSGGIAMNKSFALSQGMAIDDVIARADKWDGDALIDSARATCLNEPNMTLDEVANRNLTMVLNSKI